VEGHRSRRALIAAGLAVALGVGAPAGAAEDSVGGTVDPSGVTVTIVRWQGSDRVHATGAGGGDDPTGCDWAIVPAPLGTPPPADIGPWRPDAYLGLLTCDGVGVRLQWVGDDDVVDLEAEARRLVEEHVARVPVPQLRLHVDPVPMGLVGIESWFWATGYDGEPIVDQIDALGVAVDVRIDATEVRWAFGDGAAQDGGLGEASPARSSIRHVFTDHGTRPLTAAFDWRPRYRIDGTDWIDLPTIPVGAEQSYRVREAQAVITG
jgi:hypothetical protein